MGISELEELIPRQQNRKKVYEIFFSLLKSEPVLKFNFPPKDDELYMKNILNLERAIFNSSLQFYYDENHFENTWNEIFKTIYLNKALSIYLNLNPLSKLQNHNLLSKYLNEELTAFELCKLDAKSLFPEKWTENINKCGAFEHDIGLQNIPLEERPDGILKCGKCKSWKTEYTERQTRASDEPTSKFCYCHNCGHRWRFC